eukprot:TRINITY_DN91986_c0_g1_i1.p1 TRINITY_DN91986_c0_g1~~TRINITY_DN91986_c0_g1_i1.p1  ORF type:complete len:1054 (-),score=180.69 TRINITY_DN91986_c0_g1_i1:3-3164(-)
MEATSGVKGEASFTLVAAADVKRAGAGPRAQSVTVVAAADVQRTGPKAQKKRRASEVSGEAKRPKREPDRRAVAGQPLLRSKELAGYVFLCSNETQDEVLRRNLFAARRKELVRMQKHISDDSPLFLLNFESLKLLGTFAPIGAPEMDIEPEAYGGKYPAQVQVKPIDTKLRVATVSRRIAVSGAKFGDALSNILKQLESGIVVAMHGKDGEGVAQEKVIKRADTESYMHQPLFCTRSEAAVELISSSQYPLLARYILRKLPELESGPLTMKHKERYYGIEAGLRRYTSDGLLIPRSGKPICFLCHDTGHSMFDCPSSRCAGCFELGHDVEDCPGIFARVATESDLTQVLDGAHETVERGRCTGLRSVTGGDASDCRVNCTPLPKVEEFRDIQLISFASGDDGIVIDPGVSLCSKTPDVCHNAFERWGLATVVAGNSFCGGQAAMEEELEFGELQGCLLHLLAHGTDLPRHVRNRLAAASRQSVLLASSALASCGALLPPAGLEGQESLDVAIHCPPPQLTALGWWLAQVEVPADAACALLHAALWEVLLPMAVVVVLLHFGTPPELCFAAGAAADETEHASPRQSEHYWLASSYFDWRLGREKGSSRKFGSDDYWEMVDEHIVAICKHAQQSLGYQGDDVRFVESEGELMNVRCATGRPWTVGGAFSTEKSTRWSRFQAALCAAFPPRYEEESKAWVSSCVTSDGTRTFKTVVNSQYAELFAPVLEQDEPPSADDARCEVVRLLRKQLAGQLSHALDGVGVGSGGAPAASVMDDSILEEALRFLRPNKKAAAPAAAEAAEASGSPWIRATLPALRAVGIVGRGLLQLLGRENAAPLDTETVDVEAPGLADDAVAAADDATVDLTVAVDESMEDNLFPNESLEVRGSGITDRDEACRQDRLQSAVRLADLFAEHNGNDAASQATPPLEQWITALAEDAALQVLKAKAVKEERYRDASAFKARQLSLQQRLAYSQSLALQQACLEGTNHVTRSSSSLSPDVEQHAVKAARSSAADLVRDAEWRLSFLRSFDVSTPADSAELWDEVRQILLRPPS